jgi:alpha-ribazole phosphatase
VTHHFWLLRHAPVLTPPGLITGQMDLPADTTSPAERFRMLASTLPVPDLHVQSGLLRTRQTADALMEAGLPLPPPQTEPRLREQHFGTWQGQTWTGIHGEATECGFWEAPATTAPPGGESFAGVITRTRDALNEFCTRTDAGHLLLVIHAGSIRAALAVALDLSPAATLRLCIDPLSLTRLDWNGCDAGWSVRSVNL